MPPLLEGHDIIGQAQTGTGKTAAFALPILNALHAGSARQPKALVLAPTRELAIQVAEAFQTYAKHIKGFRVLPIYGGQSYEGQIRALKRGVDVVVGTPGRVMDHMRKGTLKLDELSHMVLDEADEMLRMGFIDDVEWVLSHTPEQRQTALFSATMPKEIAKVAKRHLRDPVQIQVAVKASTNVDIRQRYWPVAGLHKLDALTRILEAETFDAIIVFVRTKTSTVELSDKLAARGYSSAALNGDISQQLRERTIEQLKQGRIDILVATDVAARGLDVPRVSHVINYDIPYDTEAYVHRIGRTGRAGRAGEAILFVARRETRMLRAIERATGATINVMQMPSTDAINARRSERFREQISSAIESGDLTLYRELIATHQQESGEGLLDIAAALASLLQGDQPFFLKESRHSDQPEYANSSEQAVRGRSKPGKNPKGTKKQKSDNFDTYRIEVGHNDGAQPGNIVGAIANEAGIDSQYIGRIQLFDSFSTVDLPKGMPKDIFQTLKKARVCNKPLALSRIDAGPPEKTDRRPGKAQRKRKKDKSRSNS